MAADGVVLRRRISAVVGGATWPAHVFTGHCFYLKQKRTLKLGTSVDVCLTFKGKQVTLFVPHDEI